MAKFKKSAAKKAAPRAAGTAGEAQAARLGKTISESAQQIWLAGMGAFKRTQAEGSKLFESLVRDGLSLEQSVRKVTGHRADAVRDAVESGVDQARGRASDTWDRLEKVFEDRVQRALIRLGVPGRDDLNALTARVERLTDELRKSASGRADSPARAGARAGKSAANKAPGRKAGAKKAPAKKVAARTSATTTSAPRSAQSQAGSDDAG